MANLNFADFEQVKKFSSYFADFEQVKKFSRYFADFEQVKNLIVILLTLNKLKKLTIKLPWKKLDAYAFFFGHGLMSPALHPGFSDL